MKPKALFQSKTIIVNALAAAAVLYPPVGAFVQANPEASVLVLTAINFLLRLVTRQKVALFPES